MLRLRIGITLILIAFPPILAAICPLSRPEHADVDVSRERVTVLVAKQDLAFETVLDEPSKYVEERSVLPVDAPKGCLHSIDETKEVTLARAVRAGDCITEYDIWHLKARGQVACTIPVYPSFLNGAYRPFSRANVQLWPQPAHENSLPRLIMRNILILAADVPVQSRESDPQERFVWAITVAVSPEQADELKRAVDQGKLDLVYCPPRDDTPFDTDK
jgi:Flp pilus assembly protein CpaB